MGTHQESEIFSEFIDANKLHLFVKAGQDGKSQGACPFCQDAFMQLLIKAQHNRFNFDVITINVDNPPREFKELSIKPPVLFFGNNFNGSHVKSASNQSIIMSDVDDIADYLDNQYTHTKLLVHNFDAKHVLLNVYSKFSFFIRDVSTSSQSLEVELEKIDSYLKQSKHKFLCDDYLTKLDCSLLPRLQHIRVASEYIKQYRMPARFKHLWKYLENAYKTDEFQKSCPPDREIIYHWSKSNTTKDLLHILNDIPNRTLKIPDDIAFD